MEEKPRKEEGATAATTAEVIGQSYDERNIPKRWRGIYRKLNDLRAKLNRGRRNLKADAKEERPVFSSHMADAGTDSYDRDWALAMLSAEQNAILEIEQAMARIQNGTYGICETTGKPIAIERLEAVPWTRFSITGEQDLERKNLADRTQLGELRKIQRVSANQTAPESGKQSDQMTANSSADEDRASFRNPTE